MTRKDKEQKSQSRDFDHSLNDFVALSGDVPESAGRKLMRVGQEISSELRRSRRRFFFMYIIFSAIGYVASLSLCSQNAFMFRVFPVDIAVFLHKLPDPWCPITCGLFFSALPVLFLVLFLDRFQLRRMLRDLWWLPILTVIFVCGVMTLLPDQWQHEGMSHTVHGELRDTRGDVQWLIWWMLAAAANPVILIAVDRFIVKLRGVGV